MVSWCWRLSWKDWPNKLHTILALMWTKTDWYQHKIMVYILPWNCYAMPRPMDVAIVFYCYYWYRRTGQFTSMCIYIGYLCLKTYVGIQRDNLLYYTLKLSVPSLMTCWESKWSYAVNRWHSAESLCFLIIGKPDLGFSLDSITLGTRFTMHVVGL
jgi:hypothetical protein